MSSLRSSTGGSGRFPLPDDAAQGPRTGIGILWAGGLFLLLFSALGCPSKAEKTHVLAQVWGKGADLSPVQRALKKEFGLPGGLLRIFRQGRSEEAWVYPDLGWAFHFQEGQLRSAGPVIAQPASLPPHVRISRSLLSPATSEEQLLQSLGQPTVSRREEGWVWLRWEPWGAALLSPEGRLSVLQLGYWTSGTVPPWTDTLPLDRLEGALRMSIPDLSDHPQLPASAAQSDAMVSAVSSAKADLVRKYVRSYVTPEEMAALLAEVDSWGPQGDSVAFLDRLEANLLGRFCGAPNKLAAFLWMRRVLLQEIYAYRFLLTDAWAAGQDQGLEEDVARFDLAIARLREAGMPERPLEWVPDCVPYTRAPSGFLSAPPLHDCPEEHRCLVIVTQVLNRFEQAQRQAR